MTCPSVSARQGTITEIIGLLGMSTLVQKDKPFGNGVVGSPSDVLRSLNSLNASGKIFFGSNGGNVGAFDRGNGTITIDLSKIYDKRVSISRADQLAGFLFHEGVHSLPNQSTSVANHKEILEIQRKVVLTLPSQGVIRIPEPFR